LLREIKIRGQTNRQPIRREHRVSVCFVMKSNAIHENPTFRSLLISSAGEQKAPKVAQYTKTFATHRLKNSGRLNGVKIGLTVHILSDGRQTLARKSLWNVGNRYNHVDRFLVL